MSRSLLTATYSLLTALGLAIAGPAHAQQSWPTRPVTMIVPFAAGGPTDVLGRLLGQFLSDELKQQVVIENVGGAGGMTGALRVAQADPDGYTFVLGTVGTHAQNQTLYKKPAYKPDDFAPVILVADVPIALVTRKDLPVSNLKEFVAYTQEHQKTMQFGSAGAGSAAHLGCVVLNSAIGVDVTHVPYRGTGPAMQDLQAGRIDYLCDIISTAKPQIDGGTVKGISILTKQRSPVLPDLQSAAEQGFDIEAYTWNALFLPKKTPADVIKRLHDATARAMDNPTLKQRLTELGAQIVANDRRSPEYLGKFVDAEIVKWAAPIKKSGVTAD